MFTVGWCLGGHPILLVSIIVSNLYTAPQDAHRMVATRGGALRVKISRGARLEVQNGTQQDLNEMIDLVNFGGKEIVYMLKMEGFEMGPNKIWIKW